MVARQGVRLRLGRDMRLGFLCSVTFHVLVFLFAIFGLPHLLPPPQEIVEAVPVELATLSDKTVQTPQVKAEKPVEQPTPPKEDVPPPPEPKPEPPKEEPKPEPPKEEPAPPPPPPPPPPKQPEPTPAPQPTEPEPTPVPVPKQKPPEPPKPQEQTKPVEQPKPKDNFLDSMESALKDVDKKKPSSKPSPAPMPQTPVGGAKQTVNSPLADASAQPTISEKDFLRAQIEKCWNFDPGALGAGKMVIQVRIQISPDGTVTRADLLVDQGRYMSDAYYRAAADSARRAPLACSPLKIPPTRPDFYRSFPDITLNFDPRSKIQ